MTIEGRLNLCLTRLPDVVRNSRSRIADIELSDADIDLRATAVLASQEDSN